MGNVDINLLENVLLKFGDIIVRFPSDEPDKISMFNEQSGEGGLFDREIFKTYLSNSVRRFFYEYY